jgi:hypothetical protein
MHLPKSKSAGMVNLVFTEEVNRWALALKKLALIP